MADELIDRPFPFARSHATLNSEKSLGSGPHKRLPGTASEQRNGFDGWGGRFDF
jgi:hypothetical protein